MTSKYFDRDGNPLVFHVTCTLSGEKKGYIIRNYAYNVFRTLDIGLLKAMKMEFRALGLASQMFDEKQVYVFKLTKPRIAENKKGGNLRENSFQQYYGFHEQSKNNYSERYH